MDKNDFSLIFTNYFLFLPGILFSFSLFEISLRYTPILMLFFIPSGSMLYTAAYIIGRREKLLGILLSLRTGYHFSVFLGFFIGAGVVAMIWFGPLIIATDNGSPHRLAGMILYLILVISVLFRIWPSFADPFIHKAKIDWEETWEDEYGTIAPAFSFAWKMTALPGCFIKYTLPVFILGIGVFALLISSYDDTINLGAMRIIVKMSLYFLALPLWSFLIIKNTAILRDKIIETQNSRFQIINSKDGTMGIYETKWSTAIANEINKLKSSELEPVIILKLMTAIEDADSFTVKSLLKNINPKKLVSSLHTDRLRNRVLAKSAFKGMAEVVEFLLDGGVEIDGFDGDGNTALNFAARANQISIARILIERGCDVNLATDRHYTPIDFTSNVEMIDLLRKNGGKSIKDRLN